MREESKRLINEFIDSYRSTERSKAPCSCSKCKEGNTVEVVCTDGIAEISIVNEGIMVKSKKMKINIVDYSIKDLADEDSTKKILEDFLK
jgi:hypothetical protein